MSKIKIKRLVVLGIGSVLILVAASIYSVIYNDSRWIAPMDLSTYQYIEKDIPMIVAGVLLFLYIIYLVISLCKASFHQKKRDLAYTRKLSPKLGLFGFLGFFGFFGFYTYATNSEIFPFAFFLFFGFFGFFYEGKLSHTLQDELYKENEKRAELKAYRIGFALLFIIIWIIAMGTLSRNVEWCAIFMVISMSLVYALVLFLSKYYLFRFENED